MSLVTKVLALTELTQQHQREVYEEVFIHSVIILHRVANSSLASEFQHQLKSQLMVVVCCVLACKLTIDHEAEVPTYKSIGRCILNQNRDVYRRLFYIERDILEALDYNLLGHALHRNWFSQALGFVEDHQVSTPSSDSVSSTDSDSGSVEVDAHTIRPRIPLCGCEWLARKVSGFWCCVRKRDHSLLTEHPGTAVDGSLYSNSPTQGCVVDVALQGMHKACAVHPQSGTVNHIGACGGTAQVQVKRNKTE